MGFLRKYHNIRGHAYRPCHWSVRKRTRSAQWWQAKKVSEYFRFGHHPHPATRCELIQQGIQPHFRLYRWGQYRPHQREDVGVFLFVSSGHLTFVESQEPYMLASDIKLCHLTFVATPPHQHCASVNLASPKSALNFTSAPIPSTFLLSMT